MSSRTRLFIGNLPNNTKESDLFTVFSSFGEITNLDLKTKPSIEEDTTKFAFITLSAPNSNVESCIKHFSNESFNGNKLYVTRARESFLERLQKEREQAAKKEINKKDHTESLPKKIPDIKLSDNLKTRKRKLDNTNNFNATNNDKYSKAHKEFTTKEKHNNNFLPNTKEINKYNESSDISEGNMKKVESDKKRLDAMRKKRQEFKDKQMIIKTALFGIDKVQNKKMKFSDDEDISPSDKIIPTDQHVKNNKTQNKINNLFDSDMESDDEVNFEIKKQFEGKKGQKVLDLQSQYKSDKRFILDERFVDDEQSEDQNEENRHENIDIQQSDEKLKQLNILQDVLGVAITSKLNNSKRDPKKTKYKLGMVRFDPTNPEHAKFIAKIEVEQEKEEPNAKKSKNNKIYEKEKETLQADIPKEETEKVEVSKEQFYKVNENLKEAFTQSNTFSLRSLFGSKAEDTNTETQDQCTGYIPIEVFKNAKVKNPLDPGTKNPFVYDSSDSETEEIPDKVEKSKPEEQSKDFKTVWKEKLFFSKSDYRLKEALIFFNRTNESKRQNERRELKSLMKKRIYNTERKNQMFQKKIGGRKTMKKNFKKKL